MKNKKQRFTTITDIIINPPKIIDNRIIYSYGNNSLLDENGFYIESNSLSMPNEMYEELLLPYLPICIAFAVLKDIKIFLPFKISDNQIRVWNEIITSTAKAVFKNKKGLTLINGNIPIKSRKFKGNKSGLFFGGGAESLLTFAKLKERNLQTVLLSFHGENWSGSDDNNPYKFSLEDKFTDVFQINSERIKTSFFKLIYTPDSDWREYLDHNIWGIIYSALHLPFMLTVSLCLAEQLNIDKIFIGLEKSNDFSKKAYSFSTTSVNNLKQLSDTIIFERELGNLDKIDIMRELHQDYSYIAKFQYSCLKNKFERWCLSCEKCFRIWLALKIYNIDVSTIEMDNEKIERNLPKMLYETRKEIFSSKAIEKDYEEYFKEAKRHQNFYVIQLEKQLKKNLWIFYIRNKISIIIRKIKKVIFSFIYYLS